MTFAIPRVAVGPERPKHCSLCGEWFPTDCFPRDKHNPDGRRNECRACRSERRKELNNGATRFRPRYLQKHRKNRCTTYPIR